MESTVAWLQKRGMRCQGVIAPVLLCLFLVFFLYIYFPVMWPQGVQEVYSLGGAQPGILEMERKTFRC